MHLDEETLSEDVGSLMNLLRLFGNSRQSVGQTLR